MPRKIGSSHLFDIRIRLRIGPMHEEKLFRKPLQIYFLDTFKKVVGGGWWVSEDFFTVHTVYDI